MRRTLLVLMVVAGLAGWSVGGESVVVGAKSLPKGAVVCVEVASVSALEKGLNDFITALGVGQAPGDLASVVLSGAPDGVTPDLFDLTKPVRIVVFLPFGEHCAVLVAPLKDEAAGAKLLAAIEGAGLKKEGVKGKVTSLSSEENKFDHEAFMKATPEQKQNFQDFNKKVKVMHAMGVTGGMAALGQSEALVTAACDFIDAGGFKAQPAISGGCQVSAVLMLGAMLSSPDSPMNKAKALLASDKSAKMGPAAKVLGLEIAMAENLGKQFECIGLGVTLTGAGARVTTTLKPLAGSAVAAYVNSIPKGQPALLGRVPASALAGCAMRIGDLKPAMDAYLAFVREATALQGMKPESVDAIVKLADVAMGQMGSDFSMAWLSGAGFRFVESFLVKDPAAMRALYEQIGPLMAQFAEAQKAAGVVMDMKYQKNAVKHNNLDVDRFEMNFQFSPPQGMESNPQVAQMMGVMQMISTMFLGPMHVAYVGKEVVIAGGTDSLPVLQAALDGKEAGIEKSAKFQALVKQLPANPHCVGFVSLTGIANWALTFARQSFGAAVPSVTFADGPGLAWSASRVGETVCWDVLAPTAEISSVAKGVMGIAQAFGGPAGEQREPEAPAPAPAPAEKNPAPGGKGK